MCKGNEKEEPKPVVEASTEAGKAILPEAGKESDERPREANLSDILCCGGTTVPRSAVELGVWEKSLEDQSNIVSRWLLQFLNPLLSLGAHKILDAKDIGVPSKGDQAERANKVAMNAWKTQSLKADRINEKRKQQYETKIAKCKTDEEREKIEKPPMKDPSIAAALAVGYGPWTLVLAMFYYVIAALLGFIPVLILNNLVSFFETKEELGPIDSISHPWIQVIGLGIIPFFISLLQTRHLTIMSHAAVFVRTAVSTMLYRKALRVSAAGRAKTSTGQVVNMMSNDTAQLQRFLQFAGFTAVAPIQIILSLVLIYQQVGNATWVGVGFMVFLMPINTVVFSIVSKQRRTVLKYSDLRVKMMNEMLSGIRIIKFYAWERPFGKEVGTLRGKELEALTKLAYTSAIGFSLILMAAPLIQPILVFMTYVATQDEPLTASTAFTTVALFNMMRFPFAFLPMGLLQYIQSKISLSRLERYLALPELNEYVDAKPPPDASPSESEVGSITIQQGTFSWVDPDAGPVRPIQDEKPKKKEAKTDTSGDLSASQHSRGSAASASTELSQAKAPVTLKDISCHIESGSLVAVVGSVGSGKSSFLSAILGELEPLKGSKIYMPRPAGIGEGFISFCSQTPWVVNDTLRGNILFGREYDEERYEEVVEMCALRDDLTVLPAGDMTEIGERGINLSGGQKARVSLARAMYSKQTKLVLLDDPLSAVDSHVGDWIFSKAINGVIGKGTTRILVTHHVHLLSRCDKVIVLEKGTVQHIGTYEELVDNGVDFAGAIDVSKMKSSAKEDKNTELEAEDKVELPKKEKEAEDKTMLQNNGRKLVKDEEREEGSVAGSAYLRYAKAGGLVVAVLVFIIQGLGRGSELSASFWLAHWADKSAQANNDGSRMPSSDTNYYVGIYALFGFIGVLGLTVRSILIAIHRLGASKILHDGLTESILRAPVAFFDVTPTGRVLNRFAADMDKVDLELTQTLSQGVSTIFNVIGAIVSIIAATRGTFLIPLVPISCCYYLIQKWFRKTSTELQRINSIANSPIFADFSQTLSGTNTIRAYGSESRFFKQCKQSFDTMNASYVLVQLVNSWLSLRLDVLGGFIGAFIGGVAVATYSSDFIRAGWLGLALSYSIEVTNFLKHGVKMIATLEAQMNSVERVLYYTDSVSPEAPEYIPDKDPPKSWPANGTLEFTRVSMRYRDGPLVLREVSLKVNGGEKIGVCGRTGSGKSSMMISLFRITEIETDGGAILIDGVNISEIGVSALRFNLSIIPQDPIIFSNTVRYNLDPFGRATTDELWDVLNKVQMESVILELPNGLDEHVAEGGENFSQGQRQLICIARALLRKPKILVMDEATASIDNSTDAHIQTMIRQNFRDATVLTIAHRLNTIMDSDKVLVLDGGEVAEFDSPDKLLEKENGLFKAMIDKSKASNDGFLEGQ